MAYPGPIGGDLLARRYRLIDRVGSGGMSVVWRARDELLDRLVAVKWLDAELGGDELFRDLVRREAWATARIKHPAVAAVYDYGEVTARDGLVRAYVVMEMLDGEPLSAKMRMGPMPWREAVAICAEIAGALATAHEHGVVHRDITPENVMMTSSGPRVFDFGIAAQVGEPDDDANGSTFGTPTYVAPERLDGLPAQTATDVYALGVLLFETLTGQSPFPEDAWDETAARAPRAAPRPHGVPGLPATVARLCQRCLAHDPIDRPTAHEVAHRLNLYARPWWRQRPALTVGGGVAVLLVAAALAVALSDAPAGPQTQAPTDTGGGNPTGTPLTPVLTPAPSATGGASTPTTVRTSTRVNPSTVGSSTALTSAQAVARLRQVLDAAVAADAITRADVILDLRQQIDNIESTARVRPDPDALSMIETFRRNVYDRVREGSIPATVGDELTNAADALAATLA